MTGTTFCYRCVEMLSVRPLTAFGLRSLLALLLVMPGAQAEELTTVDENGLITIHPPQVPDGFRNPVSKAYERGFRQRYNALLQSWTSGKDGFRKVDNRRFFESEKWSYPNAMLHVLAGNVAGGMAVLEAEDQPQNTADHRYTLGIDLWAGFTLKGQARKFFQFGHLMDEAYRQRMTEAVAIWTATHPRETPHPIYQTYNETVKGYGPNRFGNRRVDGRRTDNFYAMTTVATYLFAEASDNEATRVRAKSEILAYVWALYHIGHGEWDSTTYHSHTMAPYLTLYDYAQDPDVRLAAKLALDHFVTSAALKNHRLTFAGASKREYSLTSQQGKSPLMRFFWLYFNGPEELMQREHDQLFAMSSAYRPAPAMLALANREIPLPVEILATKPHYENWKEGASAAPRNFETLFLGKTYTAGSIVSSSPDEDVMPLRIVFNRGKTATNTLTMNAGSQLNRKSAGDQIGQYRNLVLWLQETRTEPFHFMFAEGGQWQKKGDYWFMNGGDTWFALMPINLGNISPAVLPTRTAKHIPRASFWQAPTGPGPVAGFALEIGEKGQHKNFGAFVKAVRKARGLRGDPENLRRYRLTGTDGRVLDLELNRANDLPLLSRDAVPRDWDDAAEWDLWRTVDQDQPVVSLGWKEGQLQIHAGGHFFEGIFELQQHLGPEVERSFLEDKRDLSLSDISGFFTK